VRIAFIAVSKRGLGLSRKLLQLFPGADIYVPPRFLRDGTVFGSKHEETKSFPVDVNESDRNSESRNKSSNHDIEQAAGSADSNQAENRTSTRLDKVFPLEGDFTGAAGSLFQQYNALVFISAVAVAVRGIAPSLRGKTVDPAVVVVDEGGRYAISLLSGHLGGANQLAVEIAGHLGAEPVVTTATDGQGLPAFDDLARKYGWQIENLSDLKKLSAALLEGQEIVLYSSRPLDPVFKQKLGGEICFTEQTEDMSRGRNGAVLVTNMLKLPSLPQGLPYIVLRPRAIAAGIGCRRGVPAENIITAVKKAFDQAGLSIAGLACLATGEFKADEAGLIEAAGQLGVPLKIFKRTDIVSHLGNIVTSDFVEEQVGVGAVAEPCARLGSGGGEIVLPVQRGDGITVSLAEEAYFGKVPSEINAHH